MKHFIGIPLHALAVLFITGITLAGFSQQGSWIGGPGVPGPVVDYWNVYFDTQSNTQWSLLAGKLFLDITFTSHTINSSMEGCKYAFPADMDGDGDLDVLAQATLSSANYKVAWFENDGNGGGWDIHIVSIYYPGIWCAYPGDLDSDGDMDVIGGNLSISHRGVEWWRNDDGVGDSWTRFYVDDQFGTPVFVCCSDINNDETLDVIAPEGSNLTHIAWWESYTTPPDSVWEKHLVSSSSLTGRELFPVDLDQDGDMDILCACEQYSSGLQFWENLDGIGTSWSCTRINATNDIASSVHAADIDGDNDLDVVACGTYSSYVSWFENLDGSCSVWVEHELDSSLENPKGVHAADVTEEGYIDILVADYDGGKHLYLYRNMDGVGDEWVRFLIKWGWWFKDVDVADFNGDGKTDILAASSVGTEVSWHEIVGYSSGWLESSILDLTGYPQWDSIAWTAEEPPGTDLFFQVKSSNDWENMGAWCDTIFEPGSLAGYIDSTHRYIQYRVSMTSDSGFATPVLDEVRFYWSNLGIEGGSGIEEFLITAVPNPSGGGVSIEVPSMFAEEVELLVYDLSGKLLRKLVQRDGSTFFWDGCDYSGHEAPAGTYIIRGVVEDRSATVRFVKL